MEYEKCSGDISLAFGCECHERCVIHVGYDEISEREYEDDDIARQKRKHRCVHGNMVIWYQGTDNFLKINKILLFLYGEL